MDKILAFVLTCVAAGLSIGTCGIVLFKMWHLEPRLRSRLLARQLMWLAVIDISVAIDVTWRSMEINGLMPATLLPQKDFGCARQLGLTSWGEISSALCEAHIAVGWACSWLRWRQVLVKLDKTLNYVVLLAAVLSSINYWYEPSHIVLGFCYAGQGSHVELGIILGCVVICVASCVVTLYYASAFSGEAALQPVLRRSWMYPASFLITSSPFCYALYVGHWFDETGQTAFICFALTGFANALTYFVQSRYAKTPLLGSITASSHEIGPPRQPALDDSGDLVSFHAIFDFRVSVVEVPQDQLEAYRNAERDTQLMEDPSRVFTESSRGSD